MIAALIWAAVTPGLRVEQTRERVGIPPTTPAWDQSIALFEAMMPDHCSARIGQANEIDAQSSKHQSVYLPLCGSGGLSMKLAVRPSTAWPLLGRQPKDLIDPGLRGATVT